jgi:hypothetical protein
MFAHYHTSSQYSNRHRHLPAVRARIQPNFHSASRFSISGIVEVTLYPASPEYQAYYRTAVLHAVESRDDRHASNYTASAEHKNTVAMFRKETVPNHPELTQAARSSVYLCVAVSLPVFSADTRRSASDAILPHYEDDVNTCEGLSSRAACYAFGFLECQNLGRAPEECRDDGDGPLSSVLLLEYEEDYLWAWLQDVDFELGNPWTHLEKLCKGCGDRFRQVSLTSFWRVKREELTQ